MLVGRNLKSQIPISKYGIAAASLTILILLMGLTPICLQMTVPLRALTSSSAIDLLDAKTVFTSINHTKIVEHLKYFTGLGSRMTGYPGAIAAADYIEKIFKDYGLSGVERFSYTLTVPFDYGANLTILSPDGGKVIKIYALAPNMVQTCPTPLGGLEGQLIYVKDGDLSDFNGLPVDGSIVLMDFNSRDNWQHAQMLGAKAVIFIEPESTFWWQGYQKIFNIPLNFPRLWVTKEDARYLLSLLDQASSQGANVYVNVKSNMQYENVDADHIYGFIEGTDPVLKEEIFVLTAHYDSWSVVPSLAPGANEAVGISTLLELARFFSEHPPKRTLMFLALSGHNQALEGARQFIEEMYWGRLKWEWWNPAYSKQTEDGTKGIRVRFFIGLDFNTLSSNIIAPMVAGWRYQLSGQTSAGLRMQLYLIQNPKNLSEAVTDYWEIIPTRFLLASPSTGYKRDAEAAWNSLYGKIPVTIEDYRQDWWISPQLGDSVANYYFAPIVLTIEPFFYPGPTSWSYATIKHLGENLETPLDTFDRIKWENLWPQVEWIFYSLYRLQAEPKDATGKDAIGETYYPEIEEATGEVWRWRPGRGLAGKYHWHGYHRIFGQAVIYNATTAKYDPLPGALVFVSLRGAAGVEASVPYLVLKATHVYKVGEDGRFTLVGWGGVHYAEGNQPGGYNIEVFYLNSTGHILYAPDMGDYGGRQFPFNGLLLDKASMGFEENPYLFVAFPCGSLYMPLVLQPNQAMASGSLQQLAWGAMGVGGQAMQVLDTIGHTPARFFGGISYDGWNTMIFLDPNRRYEIVFRPPADEPTIVLTNATRLGEEGKGFQVRQGETVYVTIEDYAKQFYHLNYARAGRVAEFGCGTPAAIERLEEAERLINQAENAYINRQYDKWYSSCLLAWGVMRDAWYPSRTLFDDVVNSVIFFFALLIPFSFILEKLLTSWESPRRKLITMLIIFIVFATVMGVLHPGFQLASNIIGVLIGFVGTVLAIPILVILYGEFQESLRRFKAQLMGYTVREVELLGATGSTLSVGVAHMRRRRLRTFLTLISVTMVVYALIQTSSIVPIAMYQAIDLGKVPPYQGALIYITTPTEAAGGMGLPTYLVPPELLKIVRAEYGDIATIAPRAEAVPLTYSEGTVIVGPKNRTRIFSLLGLAPEEFEISIPKNVLKEGRWFEPGDYYNCIISIRLAEIIGAAVGDTISIGGSSAVKLQVIGIVDDVSFNAMKDIVLNIRPQDRRVPIRPGEEPKKLLIEEFIICPYQFVMDFPYSPLQPHVSNPSHLLSIAVKFHDPEQTMANVEKLALSLSRMYFFVGYKNSTLVVQRSTMFQVTVTPSVFMPLVLSSLLLFNVVFSSIYERRREIYTLSSIGLSPMQVAMMFISENIVYAIIAAVFGYIGVMMTNAVMGILGIQMGLITNFSSWAVTLSAAAAIIATLLPALFTFRTASGLVTPSLERRWAITTKPRGDEWTIPLPFKIIKEEVGGIILFLMDFFQAHAIERAGLGFAAKNPRYAKSEDVDKEVMSIGATVLIEPYDAGVSQEAWVDFLAPRRMPTATVSIRLHRLTGTSVDWERFNYRFVDDTRKQLLQWRGLPNEKREEYIQNARQQRIG